MEDNKLLEKIWSEAQTVEVPDELSPERMKERIGAGTRTADTKNKSEKGKRGSFRWRGTGGRVAAAAIVMVLSLGVYRVAGSQQAESAPETGQEEVAEEAAQTGNDAELILAAGMDGSADADETDDADDAEETVVTELGDYHLAKSYGEVYEMLEALANQYNAAYDYSMDDAGFSRGDFPVEKEQKLEAAETEDAASDSSASGDVANAMKKKEPADYSTTNLQVTGVDESDIVKTDGHYIYIAGDDQVQIVDTGTGEPRQLGSIRPEFSGNMDRICEMYVADGKLLLIVQTEDTDALDTSGDSGDAALNGSAEAEDAGGTDASDGEDVSIKKIAYEDDVAYCGYGFYDYGRMHTQVLTYDITSPAGAKLLGTFEQDGSYADSRKTGDQLYLFTDYGVSCFPMLRGGQKETADAADGIKLPKIQGQTIPADCIYLPGEGSGSGVLISAVNVNEPEKATDQKMIFNGSAQMYVTESAIYLYQASYSVSDNRMRTSLTKFKTGGGKIQADCAEAVPGYVEDTFAIHESGDGYLYVLTTSYDSAETTNQLFVLDEKLKIHGKIGKIAVGETVYAARFVDDIGYFVTYRNMDPLFTVDFSDRANPVLIGELEIPGFSDYLQFWDDGHLIGVGEERKAEDSSFIGIKVSLYDISDPTNVKESSKVVLEDAYYAPASYNYKALLADSRKNVVAFLTEDKGGEMTVSQRIFTVKDGKLVKAASDRIEKAEGSEYYGSSGYRNLYIGDKLYLAREGLVIVYDMSDGFKRTATVKLR